MDAVRIGTCSWNYDSWIGLVYSGPSPTAAGYLTEYARSFRTVEIDSWFYKIPDRREVLDYLSMVDPGFRFTCKVSEEISLTHKRSRPASKELVANPGFLSTELFARYLERIEPMLPQLDAIMLEFEYLNREKMPSPTAFLDALDRFSRSVPAGLPLAVEPRNKNFLTGDYFRFLGEKGWIHVFSEKLYMPHAYDVYASFGTLVSGNAVIRLLGGDRAAIEKATAERWDAIVDPKPDKAAIVDMSRKITLKGGRVIININNHYEGSAPLTAAYFQKAFAAAD